MLEEYLWVEKFRPKRVADCILPASLKDTFQAFIDQKSIPNLILSGTSGVGKTTVAKAMLEELDCDYITINASLYGNIDTLRNEILNFVSSVSLSGGRKYVILDEADYLNANTTQPALRNFMEEFSKNAGFIFTCNFKNRIIEALHSRCATIDFTMTKAEKPKMAALFFKRACSILSSEGVEFEQPVVAELVQKYFPDWRRVLNELQRYSVNGKIDTGILAVVRDVSLTNLVEMLKGKKYTEVRRWVSDNLDNDQTSLYRRFYDQAAAVMTPDSIPALILLLGKYQYQAAFAADAEINTMAFLTEVLVECTFI
jgi:DNA polymerase III delta prime subunit